MPPGEIVSIRDDQGHPLLYYRSFASALPIVAALTAGIVAVTGIAATLFLIAEQHALNAIISFVLAAFFSLLIAMLVPPLSVTILSDDAPLLTLSQVSRVAFPTVIYAVATPQGHPLAYIRRSVWSRLGRNRWRIESPSEDVVGLAIEESLRRALVRKAAGKFRRELDADVVIRYRGQQVGTIYRRARSGVAVDVLDLSQDTNAVLDRRVAVALGTLVLGGEP